MEALDKQRASELMKKIIDEYENQAPHWPRTDTIYVISKHADHLAKHQRTPGTNEICAHGPERCSTMYDFQWDDCDKENCPMRPIQAVKP